MLNFARLFLRASSAPESTSRMRTFRSAAFVAVLSTVLAVPLALPQEAFAAAAAQKEAKGASAKPVAKAKSSQQQRAKAPRARVVRKGATKMSAVAGRPLPQRLSQAQRAGLAQSADRLALHSSAALVFDQETGKAVYEKNAQAVLPIASITKLMTSLVVMDLGEPLDEILEVTQADVDTERHSSSRLRVGARLSRGEMLHLALMSSENRAAHALGRLSRLGLSGFVQAMNDKARQLGMVDSRFSDPTGLSNRNVSTARDLAKLVDAAHHQPLIRQWSTATETVVGTPNRVAFRNTNRLVFASDWDIGISKTGYINEAGRCLVMQTRVGGRPYIFVLLDSRNSAERVSDAQRLRRMVQTGAPNITS